MAKGWRSKLIRKLVGQGLASKYLSKSPEPQVGGARPFTEAPEKHRNHAAFTQAPTTSDSTSMLKPLKPTLPPMDTQISRTEYDISAAALADSELPRIPIDLSCSLQECVPDNEPVNTGEDVSGFKHWDAKTARGYPVVAPPPMTGIGRYRRSKTATKEWVEANTRKQLGHVAPCVMSPIEEITGPSDWEGPYSKSAGASFKSGGKSPVEVDPDTGANVARGFSTVSVAKNRGASNSIGSATNATMSRISAIPAVHSFKDMELRQASPLQYSCIDDGCAIESYDSPRSERYVAVREAISNDRPLDQFSSENQRARSDAGRGKRGDGADCDTSNSAKSREFATFWDRARPGEETPQQQPQNHYVEAAAKTSGAMGSSPEMDVGGGSESTSYTMPAHTRTGPDLRFINRYWDRLYDNQRKEDALRAQGIDVEAEREKSPKEPLYAIFKTGTFEELEEYQVKKSPPSPIETMKPRNVVLGRVESPQRVLYKNPRPKGPGRNYNESDSWETITG